MRKKFCDNSQWYCGIAVLTLGMTMGLTSCMNTVYAPVIEGWSQPQARSSGYRVRTGDTLYSIAWGFGLDYRALAAANHLTPPYSIYSGQILRMDVSASRHSLRGTRLAAISAQSSSKNRAGIRIKTVPHWVRPAQGPIMTPFSPSLGGNKGIDITGRYGEPILAAASGIVVYSGDGVRGYGNLIIIKHSDSYLSAYAFNKRNEVKEGFQVRAGQPIAEMGRDETGRVLLHFEIRYNGNPINPIKYVS
ncbi:MAG: hypothetical protein A3F41_03760 [Coxiella sp. RIFCSPHIGHO2_12_FULL_44_14]|nr:MAG: hypothetical protein A3F41_03760 [Coxiella sp. RIFCSPHIGHO2_12_FULL_44_14]